MLLKGSKTNDTVTYRIGSHGPRKINWSEWKEGPIYIARREADLPKADRSKSRAPFAGQIITLGIANLEFSEGEYDHTTDTWSNEDYLLQIKDPGEAFPAQPEYTEVTQTVDLSKIIDYYAKDFEVKDSKVLSYEWAINPVTNKVIFVLTTQKK